jgi:hypothetical protein
LVARVSAEICQFPSQSDTWEKPHLFGRGALAKSVAECIDEKCVSGIFNHTVEVFPMAAGEFEVFRRRVMSKRAQHTTKLIFGGRVMNAKGHGHVAKVEVFRQIRQWAIKQVIR